MKAFIEYARHSALLKTMILLVAIPNMVLPLLTYQFNVAVDAYYATEHGAINFFGFFRGVTNAVVFGALMISSRVVTRWGIPTTLMVHPFNYLISFSVLFLRLDIFTAAYARFSTELFKNTLNNPSRAILYNFFPKRIRGLVRVVLRGNVVRAADFSGSALLLVTTGLLAPHSLSLVAVPLVMIWLFTNLRIKKTYSPMLLQSLAERQLDWKAMEDMDFRAWFQDPESRKCILEGLASQNPDVTIACGEILARARPKGWTEAILVAVEKTTPRVQGVLLNLLPKEDAPRVRHILERLKEFAPPETLALLHSSPCTNGPVRFLPPTSRNGPSHPDPTGEGGGDCGSPRRRRPNTASKPIPATCRTSSSWRGHTNDTSPYGFWPEPEIRILKDCSWTQPADPDPERRSLALDGAGSDATQGQSLELAGRGR